MAVAAVVLVCQSGAHDSTTAFSSAIALDEVVCSAQGTNCADSRCCIDGGKKGFQCYQKDKNWAECFDAANCTPGVHEGEKEGHWDASGTFQLAKWSCDPLGNASRPACWAYDKAKCPVGRCSVVNDKCKPLCSTLMAADSCWQSGNCMWAGEKCAEGCWETKSKDTCKKSSNCQWFDKGNQSSCGLACHVHGGEPDCPHADQCTWDGQKCKHDECSAPGEDCTKTKCCSTSRGGLGMICYEKMDYWATCMDTFNKTAMKDWTGKKLGVRAFQKGKVSNPDPNKGKIPAGCSWAGEECSETKTCCNEGYNCNKKDDTFSGCVQAVSISTWAKEQIPLPEGWSGENLGGWRGEYQVQPAPAEQDMAGTSFYCIMAVVPDSSEMGLLWMAYSKGGSIFGCNASSVYRAWQTGSANWDTAETTVINTAVFLHVMEQVKEDGIYQNYDWTIKVDADCVFLPDRLRSHLWSLRPPANQAIYLKNNNLEGLGNQGFLGAIEVFSKNAIDIFMDNSQDCGKFLGTNSGEDGFFKGCMDALGVGFVWDQQMFKPNFDPAICTNGVYAAYHPIKYPSHWARCWDLSTGQMCSGLTYDCGGDLDPPVSSAGIR